ncbi:hypothetical protein CR513_09074, partial [Mucuna pruriens]
PLTRDNYNSWHRSMKLALNGKNKFCYVDGPFSCPIDVDTHLQATWKRNDNINSSLNAPTFVMTFAIFLNMLNNNMCCLFLWDLMMVSVTT